jgi:hypothetical protein
MADEKPKYTPEGLPVVSKNTMEISKKEFSPEDIEALKKYSIECINRITESNPEVMNFMDNVVSSMPYEHQPTVSLALVCLYELLRLQADANRMWELYK